MGTNEVGIENRSLFMALGDVPDGTVTDAGYNYGKVGIGESEDWETSIINEGTAHLDIIGIYPDLPDFFVSSPGIFPQRVLPGNTLTITITFSPIDLGVRQGKITTLSNSVCQELPRLSLRGQGVIRYLRPSPSAIEETLLEGEEKVVPLELTNIADKALIFTLTILREWLSVDPDSGIVEAGGKVTVNVTLDATSDTLGEEVRTNILIDTDASEDERVVVPVTLHIEEATITVSLPSSARPVNENFDIGIAVDNGSFFHMPIAEAVMQLGFEASLLEVQSAAVTPRCESMSNFVWDVSEPGILNLTISDDTGHSISPGTDDIVTISFAVQGGTVCGDSTWLDILDITLSDTSGSSLEVEVVDGPIVFLCRGDVDINGTVNIVDVLAVVNHILDLQPLEGEALDRADCNADEIVNILDALGIVNVVLGSGSCEP